MGVCNSKKSTPRFNPFVSTTPIKRRSAPTPEENTSRATASSFVDQEEIRSAESSPVTPNFGVETMLRRSHTVRRGKREPRVPILKSTEMQDHVNKELEKIWERSETPFSQEQPIGNCWPDSPTKLPSTRSLCTWCGQKNCPVMCFVSFQYFNPGSDGSGHSASSLRQSPIDEQLSGDGSPMETSESPTLRLTTNPWNPLSLQAESTLTSITPTGSRNTSSSTGVDVMKQRFPTALSSSSRTATSYRPNMNPFLNGSSYHM